MGQRQLRQGPNKAERAIRGLLVLGLVPLSYFAVTQALAAHWRVSDPELAHKIAPYDGRVLATLSEKHATNAKTEAERTVADKVARDALRREPLAVGAVVTLGIDAEIRGQNAVARRGMDYANWLSRRDLRGRLWMIEYAVAQNDIGAAVRQYDIALRTSRQAPQLLFPVLADAITEPHIRRVLVEVLRENPPWMQQFILFVAGNAAEPRVVVALYRDLERVGVPIGDPAASTVINALIANGLSEEAWAYYALRHPHASRSRSRNPRFTENIDPPSFLDWMPAGEKSGISSSIQPSTTGGVFDFSAPPGVGGTVLQQMQMLPPGNYRFRARGLGFDAADRSKPYWALNCNDGRQLGRAQMKSSEGAGAAFEGSFAVPRDCVTQFLLLVAQPSETVSGVQGQIEGVELWPEG